MLRWRNAIFCGIVALGAFEASGSGLAAAPTAASATLEAHLAAALSGRDADDRAISTFYAARNFAPLWLDAPARVAALREAVQTAPSQGLPDRSAALPAAVATPADELALTRAYLDHARAVSSGLLNPQRITRDITRGAVRPSVPELLAGLAEAADPVAHLAGLAPSDPGYRGLVALLATYRAMPADVWGAPVPGGPTLKPGDLSARVPVLRARLAAMGDLADAAPLDEPTRFDGRLVAAVEAFQARHGLNQDGAVGPMTLAALNASPADRAAQIAVNLERMRWLNHPMGQRRIVVNQADFSVTFYDGDTVLFSERVIIGMVDRQTPEFSDQMTHLVFNPTWFVPRSIATRDILPKLHADPTYLARSNMVLTRGDGGPVPLDTSAHDFTAYDAASFPYRIRQRPDPANALGQVKFMFPNNHAVYLHDTPSRSLFNRDRRAFSSGCVRVRDPLRLAALLLAPQYADPEGAIQRIIENGRERHVTLEEPVPVHLLYRTVWIDETGQPQFRGDVYGRDAAVRRALAEAGVDLPS